MNTRPRPSGPSVGSQIDPRLDLLRAGTADAGVQAIAAEMLTPPKRGRPTSLPRNWFEIGERFEALRADGVKYEDALLEVADEYGCSDSHARSCIAQYNAAMEEARK